MRYISFKGKKPEQDWLDKADQLLAELKAASDAKARNAIIDANSKVWGELKEWLLELSHKKCWFSEAKDCFSHWEVEHFRPKKTAKDLDSTQHDCYWWLAFNWQNFRICGNAGNRKKSTFFPLHPDSTRAKKPDMDYRQEVPLLLDPNDEDDPNLLSFNVLGEAVIAPHVKDIWEIERVNYSIDRLNLDFGPLMDKRKVIWNDCWQHIEEYRDELAKWQASDGKNMVARTLLKASAKALREMLEEEKELSAVARACILSTGDPRLACLLQSA